jgi:ATP-GRASP peptide maturase of grasp-with-spasm system
MLLIISEVNDLSTSQVMKWLQHYNVKSLRINKEESINIEKILIANSSIECILNVRDFSFKLSDIKSYWYRRGNLINYYQLFKLPFNSFKKNVITHLNEEMSVVYNYIYDYLDDLPKIGSFKSRDANKLIVLKRAISVGLEIPSTWIVDSKGFKQYQLAEKQLITKSIFEGFTVDIEKLSFMTYTEEVKHQANEKEFYYSLFQEKIEKEADIRVFYLNGVCYSMAIMSQNDPQTQIDFRKYNRNKKARSFPFKLPKDIEFKITKLMTLCKLESGSLDLVLTRNNNFVFLEINPVGQFSMTSVPCNYYVEKKIALFYKSINQ